jgi:hypothetical protein
MKKHIGAVTQPHETEALAGIEPTHLGILGRADRRLGRLCQPNSGGPPLKKAGLRILTALITILAAAPRLTMISIPAHSRTGYIGTDAVYSRD